MKKVLKRAGIVLTLVVVLAVLMTSAVMAAPNPDPGTCPNPECPGDCEQTKLQTQTRDCLKTQDCICLGDQTQTQAGEPSLTQTQTQAGEPSLTQTQTQNAGESSQTQTQTQAGEPSQTQTQTGKVS